MRGARRLGPASEPEVRTYSVIGKELLQLQQSEPFNSAQGSRHWRR